MRSDRSRPTTRGLRSRNMPPQRCHVPSIGAVAAIQAIRALSARVGIPGGLHELGIQPGDLAGWVDAAAADPSAPPSARR